MPDEQATRSAARCDTHPGTASIAVCEACRRALCLRCAIPVRGRVYGRECLADVLGPEGPPVLEPAPARPRDGVLLLAAAALLVSIIGSVLPWTSFGVASVMFGGWAVSPLRWSMLASTAAALGLLLASWLVARERLLNGWNGRLLFGLAAVTALGSVLHVLNPPPFTHAWAGPWVTLGGAVIASAAVGTRLVRQRSGP